MIYAIALSKGGSTKTTTAAELVWTLVQRGRKVLAVDLDSQGNLGTRLGITDDTEAGGVAADVLLTAMTVAEAAVPAPSVPGADILIGNDALGGIDSRPEAIVSMTRKLTNMGEWDDVVIDTPPHIGNALLAALLAADTIIVPVACESESWEAIARLEDFLQYRVSPAAGQDKPIDWFIPTKYDRRRVLDVSVAQALAEAYDNKVTNPIREGVVARESYAAGEPVGSYDSRSGVAQDYATALTQITQ